MITSKLNERFIYGGIGGLAPVLLSLLVIDLKTLLLTLSWLAIGSYLIKVIGLFLLGGLVAWLHKKESDPTKLFQLGIAGPALITAALNGSQISLPQTTLQTQTGQSKVNIDFLAPAYAQPAGSNDIDRQLKQFSLPRETVSQQVKRGLFGSIPDNLYYVISGSFPTAAVAEKNAVEARSKGFAEAAVYAPYGSNPYYAVVIGAQLTLDDARQLREKAIKSGLAKDTYIWTFPQSR
jgi:hypothetical protein